MEGWKKSLVGRIFKEQPNNDPNIWLATLMQIT